MTEFSQSPKRPDTVVGISALCLKFTPSYLVQNQFLLRWSLRQEQVEFDTLNELAWANGLGKVFNHTKFSKPLPYFLVMARY